MKGFKNFTVEREGFKIAFNNDLVISVVFSDYTAEERFDENGNFIDINNLSSFSFNQAELAIFTNSNRKMITGKICSDIEGYSKEEEIVRSISPAEFAIIVGRVSSWK